MSAVWFGLLPFTFYWLSFSFFVSNSFLFVWGFLKLGAHLNQINGRSKSVVLTVPQLVQGLYAVGVLKHKLFLPKDTKFISSQKVTKLKGAKLCAEFDGRHWLDSNNKLVKRLPPYTYNV